MDKLEYIDRAVTIEKIKAIYCADCNNYNEVRCRACLISDALDYIADAPAADVAPVVHGRWEEHCEEDGFVHHRCSKCRKNAFYEYKTIPLYEEDNDGEIVDCGVMKLDIIEKLTSFCPHCGAKMDEEEKHDPKG